MGILSLLLVIFTLTGGLLQTGPAITAPVAGAVLSGPVEIQGSTGEAAIASAELAFAYAGDPTGTWFILQRLPGGSSPGVLMTWDTSQVTDGDYRLRLRVILLDGSLQETFVDDLHVRNDSVPTSTPVPPELPATEEAFGPFEPLTEVPASTTMPEIPAPTRQARTPLPPNPAELSSAAVYSILGRGALLALGLFAALGLLLRLRRP